MRYLSNNQIIVALSLLEQDLPLNLHLANQALAGGTKPRTEAFKQSSPLEKDSYSLTFRQRVSRTDLSLGDPKIRKIALNGYSLNLLLNDASFSQLLIVYGSILAALAGAALLSGRAILEKVALFLVN